MTDRQNGESEKAFLELAHRFREFILRHRNAVQRVNVERDGSTSALVFLVWHRDSYGGEFVVKRKLFTAGGLDRERLRYLAEYGNERLAQAEYDDTSEQKPVHVGEDFEREFEDISGYSRSAFFRSGGDIHKKSKWSG